ncbi:HslU--HslV peptidase ATPase subunit [Marispirochaeta aestuarii]|uniref:ATP-dependent protease ATPase subunit HslU n=1 Tax=Marispirochaeta aestuarii TaxID=1963862 RepID=A0A1Y1RX72_9SPIO|nr:HslU--HslV peptidase ATPase subunit [Marispirochaeta aestuarii]ORC34283.1 HslU--HslV peptidase ATPase subunit [Marispirochaeta aestuarii]
MIIDDMTPREIVAELDKYIIGQNEAKKAVAIALRNRTRRKKLPKELRDEIAPKNIIMIGPTGVGKTEIARRLSRLSGAPFVKVEATKYTEVGYVGRDVESMVRDLMSVAVSMVKEELQEGVREEAERRTEEAILDLLLPGIKKPEAPKEGTMPVPVEESGGSDTREKFRKMLREGKLEEKSVEVNVSRGGFPTIEVFAGNSMEEMDLNLGNLSNILGGGKKRKRVTVKRAREIIMAEELDKLVDTERVSEIARDRVQEMGIIFIDEIDKVAGKENRSGADVSREGVQRDILPIVEGSTVNTKHGMIDTSHILFIAAGAFHISKPSDLIPELQGRFPLRVELKDLGAEEFERILTQPQNALITQYKALIGTEDVTLDFTPEAVKRLSEIAAQVNSMSENIGARRLHTIMELLLEEVSFTAPEISGQTITITPDYVNDRLSDVLQDKDLSQYIL